MSTTTKKPMVNNACAVIYRSSARNSATTKYTSSASATAPLSA
jgi:hypothetical protein